MKSSVKDTSKILLIEDNEGDVILVKESLKSIGASVDLEVVKDGEESLKYLRNEGKYSEADRPDLIILDINLPTMDGLEVLKEIKTYKELDKIPVVIFTTSNSPKDILKTYGLGGTIFVTKPLGFYEYIESVKSIVFGLLKIA